MLHQAYLEEHGLFPRSSLLPAAVAKHVHCISPRQRLSQQVDTLKLEQPTNKQTTRPANPLMNVTTHSNSQRYQPQDEGGNFGRRP